MKVLCLRNNRGYTLTEVLIAMVISMILIAAATASYISQNRSYVAQESVTEINTQSKIAHDLIANEIKGSGFGSPNNLNQNPINNFTDIVTPVDSTATTDAITIITGRMIGQLWPVGVGPGTIACASTPPYTTVPAGATQVDIVYSGTETVNNTDKRFLSIDGIEYAEVSGVSGSTVTLLNGLSRAFPLLDTDGDNMCDTGRPVYLVEDVTFCVDGNSTLRRIRRNANPATCTGIVSSDDEAIAENIEDLQFAYAIDANNDGNIDDVNGNGMLDGGDFVSGAAVANFADIRAVRINVLARADRPDENYSGLGNPPAAIENRAHAQTNDNFKRRWWQTIVTIRNQ